MPTTMGIGEKFIEVFIDLFYRPNLHAEPKLENRIDMATIQPGPEVPAPLLSGQGDIITTAIEPAPSKKGKWQRFVTKIWDS